VQKFQHIKMILICKTFYGEKINLGCLA